MTTLKKTFYARADLDAFLAELPPLAFQSVTHGSATMTLRWRTLKLHCIGFTDSSFVRGKTYEVKRETQDHYLVRAESGDMIAVNRYSLTSPKPLAHFRYEEGPA